MPFSIIRGGEVKKPYNGQEITVEVAPCNWNAKCYRGCVLAVRLADGSKICNELNFSKQ